MHKIIIKKFRLFHLIIKSFPTIGKAPKLLLITKTPGLGLQTAQYRLSDTAHLSPVLKYLPNQAFVPHPLSEHYPGRSKARCELNVRKPRNNRVTLTLKVAKWATLKTVGLAYK